MKDYEGLLDVPVRTKRTGTAPWAQCCAREASWRRLLTWLWRARPKQQTSQEKAEGTRGGRKFHCCAWKLSPVNSHVQQCIFTWSNRNGWIVCDWCLLSFWVWGLDLLLDKFSVCPTSSVSFLRTFSLEIAAQMKEDVTEYQFLTWAL